MAIRSPIVLFYVKYLIYLIKIVLFYGNEPKPQQPLLLKTHSAFIKKYINMFPKIYRYAVPSYCKILEIPKERNVRYKIFRHFFKWFFMFKRIWGDGLGNQPLMHVIGRAGCEVAL